MTKKKIIIVGAGAAGFFAAINFAEQNPESEVIILEKSSKVLAKVKISGGGRCNVTHACFDPSELVGFYPRGNKALLGPFHRFMTGDVFDWFEKRDVPLKIEDDNRVFPESNSSKTIIDCFENAAHEAGVKVHMNQGVRSLRLEDNGQWIVETQEKEYKADRVVYTSGSSVQAWEILKTLGHKIVDPVPSLFTFNISDNRISEIPGVSMPKARVKVLGLSKKDKLEENGPLLVTHWGLSGPAVLKLSAWGARTFHGLNYRFEIHVNWIASEFDRRDDLMEHFAELKETSAKQKVYGTPKFDVPKRLWRKLCKAAGIDEVKNWADLSNKQLNGFAGQLTECTFKVEGKSTFKDEFVTSGGIDLSEVDFKRFESKLFPNLFFAGEVLNIDAVTGGFNFQNAWTGGWIVAESM